MYNCVELMRFCNVFFEQKTAYEMRMSDWSSDVCSSDLPGINLLEKLGLWEVSVVNFPANRRSLVTGVKASLQDGNLPSLSEFEDFLREAGLDRKSVV